MSTATLVHGYRPGVLREATNCDWCLTEPRHPGSTLCADHETDHRVHTDPTLKGCAFPLLSAATAYSNKKCRCGRCRSWSRDAKRKHRG